MADSAPLLEAFVELRADSSKLTSDLESVKTRVQKLDAPVNGFAANFKSKMDGLANNSDASKALSPLLKDIEKINNSTIVLKTKVESSDAKSADELAEKVAKKKKPKEEDGFLKKLKKEGGEDSTFGLGVKTLAGAGALAGVAVLGRVLDDSTAKAANLAEQFRRGQLDATGLTVEIGKSIPVLGGFIAAGQNIREIFTHEKEEIDKINADVALGTQLLQLRKQAAEQTRNAVVNNTRQAQSFQDRDTVEKTTNARDRKKVEVLVEYKADLRALDEQTRQQIKTRKDELEAAQEAITKRYEGKGDLTADETKDRDSSRKRAGLQAAKDIDQIKASAETTKGSRTTLYENDAVRAQSTAEEFKALNAEIDSKHAVSATEKIANYEKQLNKTGYTASEAAGLAARFGDSLKAEKIGQFKQNLEDLSHQILVTGSNARESAINEQKFLGASPEQIKNYTVAYDELQKKLKTLKVGDQIKGLKEQVETFDTTPLERLKKSLVFNNATASQTKEAIELQVKITGQEKAQELFDKLKGIGEAFKDAGKSDIDKQIDEMKRLADKAGTAAENVAKIAKARKELETGKVLDFVREQGNRTAQVGKSELDRDQAQLKADGITDPKLLAQAGQADAKRIGAELTDSLKTPFEKFQTQIRDLTQLRSTGAISQQTYNRARTADAQNFVSAIPSQSIQSAFQNNLKSQFVGAFAGKSEQDAKKEYVDELKKQRAAVGANTDAGKELTQALKAGIKALAVA